MRLGSAAAMALALALAGCSADYVEDNQSPVILRITSINAGARLESDVKTGANSDSVCPDLVDLAVVELVHETPADVAELLGFLRRQADQVGRVLITTQDIPSIKNSRLFLDLLNITEKISACTVHLINKGNPWHNIFIRLSPYSLRLRFNTTYCTKNSNCAIEYP